MSVCVSIYVLFKSAPTSDGIIAIEEKISNRTGRPVEPPEAIFGRFRPVEDADLWAAVSVEGALKFIEPPDHYPLPTASSLQGRLFINSLSTRWWSEDYPEGPLLDYAMMMLYLLQHKDVCGVWYVIDDVTEGKPIPSITHSDVHALIDQFVAVGKKSHDRDVRFIRIEGGEVINI